MNRRCSSLPQARRSIASGASALACMVMLAVGGTGCTLSGKVIAAFPDPAVDAPLTASRDLEAAVFAGGCFWGVESVFEHVKGVQDVVSGYSGGSAASANYEMVSSGQTQHAEAVQVLYDRAQVSYGQLLKIYFAVAHNPTQLNRQGPDRGPQYRSAIFYTSTEQQRVAAAYIEQLQRAAIFDDPIVTSLSPLMAFHAAEDYHQNYASRHPDQLYIQLYDAPKVAALRKRLPGLYVEKVTSDAATAD